MTTEFSRRSVMAVAAVAAIDATLNNGTTTQAQTQTSDGPRTPAGDPTVEPGAIKTRKASCNCGQLRVTTAGPDPERRSLCHCKLCQKMTGSAFSIQAQFPKEQVTIEGKSTAWKFPVEDSTPVTYRNCTSEGGTFHFCPVCGSTVYYEAAKAPGMIGVKVGCFTDPTFPPPMISGFEEYGFPWAMNVAALPMPGGHHE